MEMSDAKRLRSLEDENRKLKKLLAESMLDQAALKELLTTKKRRARRQARGCAHLRNVLQMSERRACILISADRKMIRYRSRRPPDVECDPFADLAHQRHPRPGLSGRAPGRPGSPSVADHSFRFDLEGSSGGVSSLEN